MISQHELNMLWKHIQVLCDKVERIEQDMCTCYQVEAILNNDCLRHGERPERPNSV